MHTKCTSNTKMENEMISARVELNNYANRVLGVIKMKFGLKDKSEALNKFIDIYGENIIEKEANNEYVKKILTISENHFKKYGKRKMTMQELNRLCEE
jgi:hypothetical protein